MAKLYIVAVRDRAIDAFMNPFVVSALGMALRSFGDEVKNPESPMSKHPEDYDLFHLGFYESDSGALQPLERPHQLAIGKDQVQVLQ